MTLITLSARGELISSTVLQTSNVTVTIVVLICHPLFSIAEWTQIYSIKHKNSEVSDSAQYH